MSHDLDITGLFSETNQRVALRKCGICIPSDTPIPPDLRRLALARLSADLGRLMAKAQALTAGVEVDLGAPLAPEE